jgi:hypothetical protein
MNNRWLYIELTRYEYLYMFKEKYPNGYGWRTNEAVKIYKFYYFTWMRKNGLLDYKNKVIG